LLYRGGLTPAGVGAAARARVANSTYIKTLYILKTVYLFNVPGGVQDKGKTLS
jgi:hypothetical protein